MTQEIIEVSPNLGAMVRDPEDVLKEAKKAAQALMTVVKQKAKPVIMNGEQYLEFEDWQTVARFYGLTVKVVSTTLIDWGGVRGFEATAEVLRADGMVISSANAMCLNDEDKWSTRTKYEFVDGKKTKTGEVAVPLFQLRSMAQTRACAKALRNVLAWVVVLAGFKPTPAEEMTGNENNGQRQPIKPPEAKETPTSDPTKGFISDAQRKRLFAIMKNSGYPEPEFKEWLTFNYNVDSTTNIRWQDYEAICKHVESYGNGK